MISLLEILDMERFAVLFSMAAVMLSSCAEEPAGVQPCRESPVKLDVMVPVSGMTRVTDVGDESAVRNAQVFLFRPDGSLDASGTSESDVVTIDCTAGERDIVAVVNAPSVSDVTDVSGLMSKVSLLQDNAPGSLVMLGRESFSVSASSRVSVPVRRMVAKVSIERIVADFSLQQYRDADFRLKKIYLSNVAGDISYGGSGDPLSWYNRSGVIDLENPLVCSQDLSEQLVPDTPYEVIHSFYCCPNGCLEDSFSEEWCPRHTRLVVETELAGRRCYYTMTMPAIESNHLYTVKELRITRPGSDDPEDHLISGDATFTIEVEDWDEGYSGSFEI